MVKRVADDRYGSIMVRHRRNGHWSSEWAARKTTRSQMIRDVAFALGVVLVTMALGAF